MNGLVSDENWPMTLLNNWVSENSSQGVMKPVYSSKAILVLLVTTGLLSSLAERRMFAYHGGRSNAL